MDEIYQLIDKARCVAERIADGRASFAIEELAKAVKQLAERIERLENRPTGEFPIQDGNFPTPPEWHKYGGK